MPKPSSAKGPYGPKAPQMEENIGFLISRSRAVMWEGADKALAKHNVTLAQWIVISNLHNNDDTTPAQICDSIGYDRGAMTRMIDRLEEKGIMRRGRSTKDRRAVKLDLTAAGRALYPKLEATIINALNQYLSCFTPAEVRTLIGLLQRLAGVDPAIGANHGL